MLRAVLACLIKKPKDSRMQIDNGKDALSDPIVRHSSCLRVANQLLKSVSSEDREMWNWFNCYLSGRHEYGVWCEPGAIFLRCVHCGRRSSGWDINAKPHPDVHAPRAVVTAATPAKKRVLPFGRQAAR